MKQKKVYIGIIVLTLILFIGSSYAFFVSNFTSTRTKEDGLTNMNTTKLPDSIITSNIENSIGSFDLKGILPGHKEVVSFKVSAEGEENTKTGIKINYDIKENGLGSNIKVSVYKSEKVIETTENDFHCEKRMEKVSESEFRYFPKTTELGVVRDKVTVEFSCVVTSDRN